MSKKTKEQKKLADKRRAIALATPQKQISRPIAQKSMETPSKMSDKKYVASEYDQLLRLHTVHDLRKTFIITVALFTLEFFVFYAKLKGII